MNLLLSLFLLAQTAPILPADEEWVRVVTPRFDIISSAGERRTRELARDFETLAAALTEIHPGAGRLPQTRVFVFTRRAEVQPYFDLFMQKKNSRVTGLFVALPDRATMLIDESRGAMRDRTPYHELVHYLIGNASPRPPLWLEEGLAEYYSNAEVHGTLIKVGSRIREHVQLLRHTKPIPLADLFTIDRGWDTATSSLFYAESWAAVNWMIYTDRRAFDSLLRDVSAGVDSQSAIENRFRRNVADLQSLITTYGAESLPQYPTTLQVRMPELEIFAAPVSRAETLYALGKFMLAVEPSESEGERHLREAIELEPKHARAYAALGEFENAIAADPKDGSIALQYAEHLLSDQLGPLAQVSEPKDASRFKRAHEIAQRALDLGADKARGYGVLGISAILDDDKSPAIASLEKAMSLAPDRSDYAVHLLALYRRIGERSKADALQTRLTSLHDKDVDVAVAAIQFRAEVARVNALVKEEKIDDAAVALRQLNDASPREDIDEQATQLEAIATKNREIAAYNAAVRLYNARDLRGAQKAVDDLLKSAVDPGVIADATKLRDLLRERLKHRP